MRFEQTDRLPHNPHPVFEQHDRISIQEITFTQRITHALAEGRIIGSGQKPVTLPRCIVHFRAHLVYETLGYMPMSASIPVIKRA
jgi:hypothetical protein